MEKTGCSASDYQQPGTMDTQTWESIYEFVNHWSAEVDWCAHYETNILPTLD